MFLFFYIVKKNNFQKTFFNFFLGGFNPWPITLEIVYHFGFLWEKLFLDKF